MRHLGLFEGIGGFSLASRWMGWQTVAWCEWNPFCQKVLKHHFPDAEGFGDITKTDFTKYANTIDILTGGFPCQPYSQAGKRKGKADDRHLWPQMFRAIREVQPRWIVGENVPGLLNWNGGMVLDEIKADLEVAGFEVFPPLILPACGKDAPHRRDRLWIIAHSGLLRSTQPEQQTMGSEKLCEARIITNTTGQRERSGTNEQGKDETSREQLERPEQGGYFNNNGISGISSNSEFKGLQRGGRQWQGLEPGSWNTWPTVEPTICFGDDGISRELDGITFPKWRNESIKAAGNSIVPNVVYEIFRTIEQIEFDAQCYTDKRSVANVDAMKNKSS